MIDVKAFLKENPCGILATQDGEKIRTRMIQFLFFEGRKAYFATGKGKSVSNQLKINPRVSFFTMAPDFDTTVSIDGNAFFSDDLQIKSKALALNSVFEQVFVHPDNPDLEVFYIDPQEVRYYTRTDNMKTIKF